MRTFSARFGEMLLPVVNARLTAATETPARRATSSELTLLLRFLAIPMPLKYFRGSPAKN
jgi:hypothetical protein